MHTYKLVRSKRRSIALIITESGELEVRAPLKTAIKIIEDFVNAKLSWITKKQGLVNKNPKILPKNYIDGEEFLYEGNIYKLQHSDCDYIYIKILDCFADGIHNYETTQTGQVSAINRYLFVPKHFSFQTKKSLTYWYQAQALAKITARVKYYIDITKLKYSAIKLTNAQRIWGSCTHDGVLRVNWRLIMAPAEILDYVVVHEIVHLDEHNHSRHFWRKVELILPDYKERRAWLKQNNDTLVL